MTTDTLPHVFSLPPEERRKVYDEALERAMEAAHEAAVEHKARKVDPRSIHDYRAWHTMRMVCVLVVKSSRTFPNSVQCTRNGVGPDFYIPNKMQLAQPESTDDFLLCVIPKWLADNKHLDLQGVTPDLCDERPWTEAQREAWKSLGRIRMSVNTKIYFAKRRPSSAISRGNAA